MSLKKLSWDRDIKSCRTCKFIDEYAFNVMPKGEIPHGYDGTALCCLLSHEGEFVKAMISPAWSGCSRYEKCTERQALYLDIFDEDTQSIIENPNDISKIYES